MLRSARRAVPSPVWLILALHLLVVLSQTAVFPNLRSPDERQQVDLIAAMAQGRAWPWPDPGTLPMVKGSGAGGFVKIDGIPGPLHLADRELPPRDERLTYVESGGTEPSPYPNQLIQHPPLYYLLGGAVLSLYPDWENAPFDRVFLLLRLWNALLTAAIPLLLWASARRLRLPDPLPLAAALVPLAVPEFVHTESSVNNDNLLMLLAAALTLLVVRVLTGDTSRRTALAIGLLGTLALLTKGFALMIPVWVVLAYVVAAVRFRRPTAVLSLVVAGLALLPGLAWWVRNLIRFGVLQPSGYTVDPPDRTAKYGWSDGGPEWALRFLERMNTLFFVHDQTGAAEHTAPWWAAVVALVLVVLSVVTVLVLRPLARWDTVVLLTPLFGLAAIVAMGTWELFAATRQYGGMQGRYLYAGLPGLAMVWAAGAGPLPERLRRAAPLALLAFAAAIQAVYVTYTLELFWVPDGASLAGSWVEVGRAMAAWYALPPPVLGAVLLATPAVGLTLAVVLAREARPRPPAVPEDVPATPVTVG